MKIKKLCIIIFSIIFIISLLPMNVKADDELSVVCKTSANNTYPGEIIDVLVYLDNYNSQSIKDITTMQILFNLKGDYYSYVENSLTDLSNAETYEQIYFLNYLSNKNQVQLQFSDLTNILDRNTSDLFKFKVKINDNVPIGSKFDIGPDTVICADGRQTQIYKIATTILKSDINVVDQSVADENTELNSSVIENGNASDKQNTQNNLDNSNGEKDNSVNNGNALNDSNKTDANLSTVKDDEATEKNTQPINSMNTSTNNINEQNKSNKIGITVIAVISIVAIGLIIFFSLKKIRKTRIK